MDLQTFRQIIDRTAPASTPARVIFKGSTIMWGSSTAAQHTVGTTADDAEVPIAVRDHYGNVTGVEPETMELSDDLTASQIALLCDIGEFDLPNLTSNQKRDLERLVSGGYVEPTESHPRSAFMLTAKGIEFLGKRGAGLNEA